MQNRNKVRSEEPALRHRKPGWLNLKLSHQAILLVFLPLSLQILFFGLLHYALNNAEAEANYAEYIRDVLGSLNEVSNAATRAGAIGYFMSRGFVPELGNRYHESVSDLHD